MYHHLKVAFRNLIKYPTLTSIHILGLALGITACLIIFCVVRFETSFDDFLQKKNRIYRVNLKQQSRGQLMLSGYNFYPLGYAIR